MLFKNPPVDLTSLPVTEELTFQPLDPKYLKVKVINHLIVFLLILIGAVVLNVLKNDNSWGIQQGILIGLWLLIYVSTLFFMRKAYAYKGFVIRERDVIYKTGWLWQSTLIVPFNRIQHCELSQGPFEKMFDLSKLNVFTAGGQSSDLKLPGLNTEQATKIKEFLVNRINESKLTDI